jgi:hypothetical protein
MENRPRYRSFFWPILLVGVGIVWLLSNLGIIQPVSLGSLFKLWPVILIVLGLDILFGRRYPWAGAAVGLLAVFGVVAFLVAGPKLGLISTSVTTKTETFSTPVEGVKSVEYDFDTSSSPVEIGVLEGNSTDLILADITYRDEMRFDVSGTTDKSVSMSEYSDSTDWFFWNFSFYATKWDITLAPDVPTDLMLNGGSGSIEMDLSGIELNSLRTDFGSGSSEIILPETEETYTAEIESGSGSVRVDLPANTSLTLTIDSGSGSTTVSIPADAAVRIEVMDDGSGSLDLPNGLKKSSDSNLFSIGSWETPNYETAGNQILIQILGQGSGSISIH